MGKLWFFFIEIFFVICYYKKCVFFFNRNPIPSNEAAEFYDPATKQFKYYDITNDGIFVRRDENRDRIEFWDNLFNEFKHNWNITHDFRHLHN